MPKRTSAAPSLAAPPGEPPASHLDLERLWQSSFARLAAMLEALERP